MILEKKCHLEQFHSRSSKLNIHSSRTGLSSNPAHLLKVTSTPAMIWFLFLHSRTFSAIHAIICILLLLNETKREKEKKRKVCVEVKMIKNNLLTGSDKILIEYGNLNYCNSPVIDDLTIKET